MLTLHHTWGTLHFGHGEHDIPEWDELDSYFYTKFLSFMMFNRGFYPIFAAWLRHRKDDFASLMAIFSGHADYRNKQWLLCADGVCDMPVQQFVDEHDGKALLILLLCCNPKNRGRLTSQESLVVYSRSSLNLDSMESKRSRQILHVPGHGDFIGTTDEAQLNEIAREYGYAPA